MTSSVYRNHVGILRWAGEGMLIKNEHSCESFLKTWIQLFSGSVTFIKKFMWF